MDLMLSGLVVCSTYCVCKATLRIDVDKKKESGSDHDILEAVKARAQTPSVKKNGWMK